MRTVLKYPGSKWNIARQIAELIPEHHSYVEPFFGSGAVLFSKAPSPIETINDMDSNVINLFFCIQNDPEKLAGLVLTTPFSREKYEDTYKLDVWEIMMPDEPYHKALRFLIQCWQGHGFRSNGNKVGWKNDVTGREKAYALWNWYHLPEQIIDIAERLRTVQIENRPAMDVIERFDHENVFMYLDPPYLLKTRTGKQYRYEMTDADHEELLNVIVNSKAKIMISGYESDLYNEYLKKWHKATFNSCAEYGKKRIEVVWMNYQKGQMTLKDYVTRGQL